MLGCYACATREAGSFLYRKFISRRAFDFAQGKLAVAPYLLQRQGEVVAGRC